MTTAARDTAPGLLLATPRSEVGRSVMVFDNTGQPVWYKPVRAPVVSGDLEKAHYRGRDVLVWFEGTPPFGTGGHYRGEWTMVDSAYRTVATIRAANGYQADIHDIDITADGTAYIEIYSPVVRDLRSIGGRSDAKVFETVIQQVDIASGDLLFEWHSLDWFPVADDVGSVSTPYVDYIHTNSIQRDTDGNLLVVGRNISTMFKINRTTGAVMWRLGGKRNQFALAPAGEPGLSRPHHAVRVGSGVISVFDNGVSRGVSRGVQYLVDEVGRTATRVKERKHVPNVFATVHGNYDQLADGGSLVGWGSTNLVTEYDPSGAVRWEATVFGSYRTTRERWSGRPPTRPTVVVDRNGATDTVYVSWNGETDVASWQVLTGPSRASLTPATSAPRDGFETAITVPDAPFVQVRARAGDGSVLGESRVVAVGPWFAERSTLAATGSYRPFTGDFVGGGGDEVLFYAPGSAAEYLWSAAPGGAFTATRAPAVSGDYRPLVGDFVGDAHDDVLWTRPDSDRAYLWRADGSGGFDSTSLAVPAASVARALPHRSAKAEVLWYNPGTGADRISRYAWGPGSSLVGRDRSVDVNGSYRPVVGDFDGNGWADIVWYAAGSGADRYWRLVGSVGTGSTGQVSTNGSVNGSYSPLVGRFSASLDTRDDILWYAPGTAADYLWEGTSGPDFVQSDRSTAATGTPNVVRGRPDQIFLRAAGLDGPIWVPGAQPQILRPTGNSTFGEGYRPIPGDFEGTGVSGILWYAPGAQPERLFRPRLG